MKKRSFAILVVGLLVFGGCFYSSTKPSVAQSSNSQLFLISKSEMDNAATQAYIVALNEAKNTLNKFI
ncbi:hypothetical protein [Campylobacter hyointestinalis]|uniref:hypothetical protein n=1 Tax=Campylobacter hyointestinalis TaxID=198 RepID=UPI000DCC3DBA|nr:hypothetical protein [Campylobacter hyointestinalis]RAZ54296.1 hypothetical protein CHL10074_07680 [Campylobacter hyointestinalis subsp. lawsonii]RAZ62194.1 hypothetical protein CHL9767_09050 [Campylobacter hyointestinalis subsp. lawsonii]